MSFDAMRRPAIVTDADRRWSIAQKPINWDIDAPGLVWEDHVAEQAERFEGHFGEERKPHAEWSGLWRRVWWPKADPAILHPRTAPHVPHPFIRPDDHRWAAAVSLLTPGERCIASRFSVIQFKPDDPRAAVITREAA